MNDTPQSILNDFALQGWFAHPYERTVQIIQQHEAVALELVQRALTQLKSSATFIDMALSYIPEEQFPGLVQEALVALRADPAHEMAESVVQYLSLMQPSALHPHLDELLALQPNAGMTSEPYPWRESGTLHLPVLRRTLDEAGENLQERWLAQSRLLETRTDEGLKLANQRPDGTVDPDDYLLQQVGFTRAEGQFVQLYPQNLYHLTFTPENLPAQPDFLGNLYHPTWHLTNESAQYAFGGEISEARCGVCGGPLHQLLDLQPVPDGLEVTSARLQLATCLSCLGWEELFLNFKHDHNGRPSALNHRETLVTPQFPAPPFEPVKVRLARTSSRWYWQEWGMANGRENLNRLGGHPTWIQGAEYPNCPECGAFMHFLLQLTFLLPLLVSGCGAVVESPTCSGAIHAA